LSRPGQIVVVGALHHDIVVEAERQPQRGETLMGRLWYPKFGGKGGNQAVAAARMGAAVEMVGAVGDDEFGVHLREALALAGVGQAHVVTLAGGSGMSVAIVDTDGDYAAVAVSGANRGISAERVAQPDLWAGTDVLILQNEVPEAVNLAAATAAQAAGVTVVWNAAPWRDDTVGLLDTADVLVLNAVEAAQAMGTGIATGDAAQAAAGALAARSGGIAIVTRGADGLVLATPGADPVALPARPVAGARAHGAGDVLTGALAAALSAGLPADQAASAAAEAAWRHVSGRPPAGLADERNRAG